ncbi:MAG: oligosaccharide flippase family protein [Anaerolineae bacterium]|nr:oligosaccharide flippase family protein [Anaerolineae bacterium]
MFKQFFKDSAIYWLGITLSQGIGLILLPIYARVFSPAMYGVIDILLIMAKLVYLVVALEISQALARFYTEIKSKDDRVKYASTALWFAGTMYTLFGLIAWWFADPLSNLVLGVEGQTVIFKIAVLTMWAEGLFYLLQGQLRYRLQATAFAVVSICNVAVSVGTVLILLLVFKLGVVAVFCGQFIGALAGLGLAFYFSRDDYRPVFDRAKCREMLSFSIPLVPSSIGIFVTLYIDRIMIKWLMSIGDLGIYAVGYRVASIMLLLSVGVQAALTPLIYNYYQKPDTPQELAKIFRYFTAFALLVVIGLSIFAPEILMILTTPEYYGASQLIACLAPAVLLYRMYIFAPGLSIAKQTKKIAVINIGSALLNIGLNLLLIPRIGLMGAGIATLLSSVVAFSAQMILSQQQYFVPHAWRNLTLALLFSIGIVWVGAQVNMDLWTDIMLKMMLLGMAAGGFILMGLLRVEELKSARLLLTHFQIANKI